MYIHIHIQNNRFKAKVLQKPLEIMQGMMGKRFTKAFDALLFVMNKPSSSFWMKNCIVPLDVVFIQNGKITKIHHNCMPCTQDACISYSGNGNYVIEFPGNTCKTLHITKGASVVFSNI